ncbi:MAG: aminotransferase class III-fold pyridoxal phosphate-dependent enzyme [Actinomycetota bacterium]|nr:aminotransferase class III-fold pyridoxal phosphate-dependent enzyme [Actinomycetota bacterium]
MASSEPPPGPGTAPHGADRYSFLPGNVPLAVERTEGNHIVTADGRRILDAGGGAVVTNIGHGRREVAEAAAASLAGRDYVLPPWLTPERAALTDRVLDRWLPEGLSRATFVSGGSESTDSALRLARAHHVAAGRSSKWKVIGRWPSYHGMTLATLAAGGHRNRRRGYEPTLLPFAHVAWDDPAAVEAMILAEGPEQVAAFIAEPVIGAAGGALVAPDGYFGEVADICRRHDVLLIVDEVMCGFGRCGTRFAIEQWGVTPDVLVAGKGLSGGYAALGGVYATEAVVAPIAEADLPFMFFTYGAQSSACAAADVVLRILEDEDLVARAAKMGDLLVERLSSELADHDHVAAVRGRGLMVGIELVAGRDPHRWYPAGARFTERVVAEALARDVWVYPAGGGDPIADALLLGPPFTITEAEIDQLATVVRASVDAAAQAVARDGSDPGPTG